MTEISNVCVIPNLFFLQACPSRQAASYELRGRDARSPDTCLNQGIMVAE